MSDTSSTDGAGIGRKDVYAVLGSLGAVVTVVTAVMLYFGWRRSDVQARAMGIDVSLFGFSAQDYALRSISSLYLPILFIFGIVLAWLWVHGQVTGMVDRVSTGTESRRSRLAAMYRVAAVAACTLAIACVAFAFATGMSSPPWPVDPIADALVEDQWVVPCTLVVATLAASYFWWIHARITGRPAMSTWQVVIVGTIVGATVVLGAFWMLEEYASGVGRDYASRIAATVDDLTQATVISPAPLGIRADGVEEEVVQTGGSTYYRTTGLRLLARSGGNVLLLPSNWSLESGVVVVIPDRSDLIWQFSR